MILVRLNSLRSVFEKLPFRRQLHFLLSVFLNELESPGSNVLKAEADVTQKPSDRLCRGLGGENVLSESGVRRKNL